MQYKNQIDLVYKKIKNKISQNFAQLKRILVHALFKKRMFRDKCLVRYIFKELFLYFIVMFLFFFLIFFVNNILLLVKDLIGKHIPFSVVFRLMIYSTPVVIAQSAPFATLTGFLMCLGRMMSDNEILIFRASGVNPLRMILFPVIILGLSISVVSFFVNDFILPRGTLKFRELSLKTVSSNPAIELESNTVKRMNDATIVIGNVKNNEVSDMVFFDTDSDFNQRIIVSGVSKLLASQSDGLVMQLEMGNALVTVLNKKNISSYDVISSSKMIMNIFESSIPDFDASTSPGQMTSVD